jgi:fatty-acyl-CoA synthase
MSELPGVDDRRAALERRHGPWEPRTLDGMLDVVAAERPDRPFVLTDEATCTYAEMAEWSRRLGRGLLARGVGPGERVALVVPNRPELVAMLFAIARAGAVAVPVNLALRTRELELVLRQSQAVAVVAAGEVRGIDHAAALEEIAGELEDLRLEVTTEPAHRPTAVPLDALAVDPDDELDVALATRATNADPFSPATIFYTSGTSGEPKGVVLEHDMLLRSAYGSALTRAFEDGRRILFALPLQHVFGYVEGLLASMFAGGAVILQEAFDPHATLAAVERHHASEALFVPTMSLVVVEAAQETDHDLSSLHSVMSAASSAPARLWGQLRERLGLTQLVTGYGMTETSAATTFTLPGDRIDLLVETVGRPKLGGIAGPLAEYRTVDPESGEPLAPAAEGELAVRGAIVTHGYHDAPEETAAVLGEDGWLRSGDLGRIGLDGYLRLTGRSKDLYRCGSETVVPIEVESRLTERDDVSQAHVVPIPHDRMGEVGVAFVVPAAGASPEPADLIEHCRATLARFKVPEHVILIDADELPLTSSGKVRKFLLARRARQELLPQRSEP